MSNNFHYRFTPDEVFKVMCSWIYFVISCGIRCSEIFQFSERLSVLVLSNKHVELLIGVYATIWNRKKNMFLPK